jgi:DNA-3-methyladenine glycosylase|tara:strand:+ start:1630 stop:2283 length:654 start_codon:yes stop_codon:yes gene_type:complete
MIVLPTFFDRGPLELAQSLIGKVLRHRINDPAHGNIWLSAKIIETEAYYQTERGSHSSLGFTEKRKAMFMEPGTIYMYYARGGDSLNFSARGDGNGVLIKSGLAFMDQHSSEISLSVMQQLNPINGRMRSPERLCSGQTLLCRSLGLKVPDWNQGSLKRNKLLLEDVGYCPDRLVQCKRLGIPEGRDEHLPYRFVDYEYTRSATSNPKAREHTVIKY